MRERVTCGFGGAVLLLATCGCRDAPQRIELEVTAPAAVDGSAPREKHLRVAVGGMITPRAGLAYYRKFLDYIGQKTGRHVDFVDREDYAEINALVKSRNVDVAFVCGGPYVDGHADFGMELLAAPEAYGGTVYYSYIIVAQNRPLKRFEDLRGKVFAFTDPLSNSGRLVPVHLLHQMRETPESFFGRTTYTHSHDKSIRAVGQEVVDGAAVDSLVWEFVNATDPAVTARTMIIWKSPPFGIPPVVVHPALDPALKDTLRHVFLNAHADDQGRAILDGMRIDRFVPIQDDAYNSIREMQAQVREAGGP